MLHQELPRADLKPLDGLAFWLLPALLAAVGLSASLVLILLHFPLAAVIAVLAGLAVGGMAAARQRQASPIAGERIDLGPDFSVVAVSLKKKRETAELPKRRRQLPTDQP